MFLDVRYDSKQILNPKPMIIGNLIEIRSMEMNKSLLTCWLLQLKSGEKYIDKKERNVLKGKEDQQR